MVQAKPVKRSENVAIGVPAGLLAGDTPVALAQTGSWEPVKSSPQYHYVRLEHEYVRVLQ